ncbi:MAG: cobalamin biosynthesis protein CobW [Lachnospiraceae bacterium]|nr:cobalamin biosynthesis protein CobW [Lachnospiraceae bacterium]
MTKIDIISGFLGAGKTTLIKKLIDQAFSGEKLVLIENEFGEIGIDGGFLKDAGVEITEMNSGCICCSLVGDFGTALKQVITDYTPDRVIIEPSGVGKLSDVIKAVEDIKEQVEVNVNSATTVVDVAKCKMYMKNFGEFFNNQVESAGTIVLSRTQNVKEEKILNAVKLLREHNENAAIITTPWDDIDGKTILEAMEHSNTLEAMMKETKEHAHHHHHEDGECCCGHHHDHEHHHEDEECCCGHHHDHEHHHEDEECCCGHHHDHEHHHEDEECCCGHHHDHEHHYENEECCCGHHHDHEHHHHEHGEGCTCGCHDHDGHHHHADEVFTSWGKETAVKYADEDMKSILEELAYESDKYGVILRAKGIVPNTENEWIYFDLVPGEYEIRKGKPDYTGKLCVIGSNINEDLLVELFKLS